MRKKKVSDENMVAIQRGEAETSDGRDPCPAERSRAGRDRQIRVPAHLLALIMRHRLSCVVVLRIDLRTRLRRPVKPAIADR